MPLSIHFWKYMKSNTGGTDIPCKWGKHTPIHLFPSNPSPFLTSMNNSRKLEEKRHTYACASKIKHQLETRKYLLYCQLFHYFCLRVLYFRAQPVTFPPGNTGEDTKSKRWLRERWPSIAWCLIISQSLSLHWFYFIEKTEFWFWKNIYLHRETPWLNLFIINARPVSFFPLVALVQLTFSLSKIKFATKLQVGVTYILVANFVFWYSLVLINDLACQCSFILHILFY